MSKKATRSSDLLGASPLTDEIAKWILEQEGQTAGHLHVHVSDKKDLPYWVAALNILQLFNKDFAQKLTETGIKPNDIITISRGSTKITAKFIHYHKSKKELIIKLRGSSGDEMEERWPLIDPLCLSRVSDRGKRLSPQKDARKRFTEGYESEHVPALDKILSIHSFGNRSLFTSRLVMVTSSIKKARNFLNSFEVYGEELGQVVGCDKNLIFKNKLSDLIWAEGDTIKKEIKTKLISVIYKGEMKESVIERLHQTSTSKGLLDLLDSIDTTVSTFDDPDRKLNFTALISHIKSQLDSIDDPILNNQVKYILVDDPCLILKDIKAFNKLLNSNKRIVVFSDPKSLVSAFQQSVCYDKNFNVIEDFEKLLDDVAGIYNFNEREGFLHEQIQEMFECGEYEFCDQDVWDRNFQAAKFKINLKEVDVGNALQKVIDFRRKLFRIDGLPENEKLRRLIYTCLVPVIDLITSAPIFLNDETRVLISEQIEGFYSELAQGSYVRFLPKEVVALLEKKSVTQLFSKALGEIEKVKRHYFLDQIPRGYGLRYTGKFEEHVLSIKKARDHNTEGKKKAFLGATKSNFRQVVDECMQRHSDSILFLGTSDECQYIEHRIKQAFWLPECLINTKFFPESAASFGFIQKKFSEPKIQKTEKLEGAFDYLSNIQVTPSGTFSKNNIISNPSDRKVKSGLLYFDETREMFYPLEGRHFFAIVAHTKKIVEVHLADLENGDTFLFIPEVSKIMKQSIQEILSVHNRDAYQIIYEWRELLNSLYDLFGDVKELAEALLLEIGEDDTIAIRNMRVNVARWLNAHSDIWTPEGENLKLIYLLAIRNGFFDNNNIEHHIDIIRQYVNYAQEARRSLRSELKSTIQDSIGSNIKKIEAFEVPFQNKLLKVMPLRVIGNRPDSFEVDSSFMYRLRNSSE